MRGFKAFIIKEIKENTRNYRFFILGIVFAVVGLLSPLSARFLPELLSNMIDENITIILSDPTYIDSWMQFFSNMNQMALVAFVLVFSSILSKEYDKGTLVHMVTKGLPRLTIYYAKFTVMLVSWTFFFWMSFAITLGYTFYYFPEGTTDGLFLSVGSLYLFGILLIALLMSSAAFFSTVFAPLLTVGGFLAVLFILNLFPFIEEWSPLQLASRNTELLIRTNADTALNQSLFVSALLILFFLVIGSIKFRKKALN
ncbi:ABC transporter permease subunit [Alkalibacterium sp.]|nr:MAG: ABC transporter permease [Alkalibacterium sp.]